jgi:hypothetical protein
MTHRCTGRDRPVDGGTETNRLAVGQRIVGGPVASPVESIESGGTSTMSRRTGARVRATARAIAAGLVLATVLAGCSSGGDGDQAASERDPLGGDDRDTYVLAFEEVGRDPVSGEVTDTSGCVAEAIVEGVGVDQMRDVATPREIADAASGQGASLASLGVDVDADQADAIYAGIEACGDPAATFLDAIPGPPLTGPAAECFAAELDDALVRDMVMTRLLEGDEALVDSELTARLTAIGLACAAGAGQ